MKMKNGSGFFCDDSVLYILIISFFVTTAFSIKTVVSGEEKQKVLSASETAEVKVYPKMPLFKGKSFPVVSAQAVLALDLDSMAPLYEKNPDIKLLPASTTKIVTALVAINYYDLNRVLIVANGSIPGQKMGLIAGERISADALLKGLLIHSANDAAEVLAQNYPGGRNAFINSMNILANKYRMENSNFENPTGFDGVNHYSTARDLIRISQAAMNNPVFADYVNDRSAVVMSTDGKTKHNLKNTNDLLGKVDGVLGVKTGWTENARENLVTYLERDSRKIMIALLGSQDRFGETQEIINFIFDSYIWEEISY